MEVRKTDPYSKRRKTAVVFLIHVTYCVKERSNSVSTVSAHHGAFVLLGVTLNDLSQITIQSPRFDQGHGRRQTFKGCLHQPLAIGVHFSNTEGLIQVTMISTSIVSCNIQIDNICEIKKNMG